MEQNNFKEKIYAFCGMKSIETLLRTKEIKGIDFLKKQHPYLQMFFDSPINSEIEKNTIIAISDAICSELAEMIEAIGLGPEKAKALGEVIAHKVCYSMGILKLMDKYFRNEIDQTVYYEELSKRIATGFLTLIEENWKLLGKMLSLGVAYILSFCGVPPHIVVTLNTMMQRLENVLALDRIHRFFKNSVEKFFNSPQVQSFIEGSLRELGKALSDLMFVIDVVVETTKIAIQQTKVYVNSLVEKIKVSYQSFKSFFKSMVSPGTNNRESQREKETAYN